MFLADLARPILSPLIDTLVLDDLKGSHLAADADLAATTELMVGRIGGMPRYLAEPMFLLVILFDLAGLLSALRLFRSQSPEQRRRHVAWWRNSRISVFRDFIQFQEKMGNFLHFSRYDEAHDALTSAELKRAPA